AYLAARQSRAGQTPLTARQREIMQYVGAGYSNYQIARRLGLSEGTVRKHLENAFARLRVTSRTAAEAALGPDIWRGTDGPGLSVHARPAAASDDTTTTEAATAGQPLP
ncbi:MAG: response regulator transcription factor, partial [Geodermatophilaceae bacterium]|nr:response regulator transcription factor [Geodermatophilaceae bacterium]